MSANDDTRGGRRGYDLPRGGNQRNVNTGRDNNTQQNRRGGKQQSQPNVTRTPQQQPTPPPGQQANPTPKPVEPRAQNGPPQVEQDLPAYNFNKAEVQSMLEQGIDKSIPVYKFKASADAPKGGNPWAAKPLAGMMANNKDFWIELRRQVTTLQNTQSQQPTSGPPARGG